MKTSALCRSKKICDEPDAVSLCRCLAGEEGFEPSHAGIKIRCLNQLGYSPAPGARAVARGLPLIRYSRAQPRNGWAAKLPHTRADQAAGNVSGMHSSASGVKRAKTALPEPVIRPLKPCCDSQSSAASIPGHDCPAIGRKSLRPNVYDAVRKPEIVAGVECSSAPHARKTRPVSRPAGGLTTMKRAGGHSTRSMGVPVPSTQAWIPWRKNGTSAPADDVQEQVAPGRRGHVRDDAHAG